MDWLPPPTAGSRRSYYPVRLDQCSIHSKRQTQDLHYPFKKVVPPGTRYEVPLDLQSIPSGQNVPELHTLVIKWIWTALRNALFVKRAGDSEEPNVVLPGTPQLIQRSFKTTHPRLSHNYLNLRCFEDCTSTQECRATRYASTHTVFIEVDKSQTYTHSSETELL